MYLLLYISKNGQIQNKFCTNVIMSAFQTSLRKLLKQFERKTLNMRFGINFITGI